MGKFARQFTKSYKGTPGEKNTKPSLTVPDMSLSLRQLMENHTRGIKSDVADNQGEFFDTEIPKFDDITEMVEYKNELYAKAAQVKTDIQKADDLIEAAQAAELLQQEKDAKNASKTTTEEGTDDNKED